MRKRNFHCADTRADRRTVTYCGKSIVTSPLAYFYRGRYRSVDCDGAVSPEEVCPACANLARKYNA